MRKAGRQCMDLQSMRHRGSFIRSPSDGFRNRHRRQQILLQRGQHRVGADLHFGVAGMIVTTGESQAGDGDNESSEAR